MNEGHSARAEDLKVQEGHGQQGIFVIRGSKKGQLHGHIKRQKELFILCLYIKQVERVAGDCAERS